jgi:hypothetical protein
LESKGLKADLAERLKEFIAKGDDAGGTIQILLSFLRRITAIFSLKVTKRKRLLK